MSKGREFWIATDDMDAFNFPREHFSDMDIHVIEHSAYIHALAQIEKLEAALKKKANHHICDDGWYSCPKSEEGCINTDAGDICNCGADAAVEALSSLAAWKKENLR